MVGRAPQLSDPSADLSDLDLLLETLPAPIRHAIEAAGDFGALLEVVLDLGRRPSARYQDRELELTEAEITDAELESVVRQLGDFGADNRAGIARTLHRISCLRNRRRKIVGLTMRVGRAVTGSVALIEDFVSAGASILLLGRPGVGKTTLLREAARVLAEQAGAHGQDGLLDGEAGGHGGGGIAFAGAAEALVGVDTHEGPDAAAAVRFRAPDDAGLHIRDFHDTNPVCRAGRGCSAAANVLHSRALRTFS